jgi:hypothetical protein
MDGSILVVPTHVHMCTPQRQHRMEAPDAREVYKIWDELLKGGRVWLRFCKDREDCENDVGVREKGVACVPVRVWLHRTDYPPRKEYGAWRVIPRNFFGPMADHGVTFAEKPGDLCDIAVHFDTFGAEAHAAIGHRMVPFLEIGPTGQPYRRETSFCDEVRVFAWAATDKAVRRRALQDRMSLSRQAWMAAVARAIPTLGSSPLNKSHREGP